MERVTKGAAKPATASKLPFALEGVDHILLLVSGMEPAVRFYTAVLGSTVENALPEYGMLQLRAGAVPEASWAKLPVAGGRNLDHSCLALGSIANRSCAGISHAIASRSSAKAYLTAVAARACRSASAIRPENVIESKGPPPA